MNDQDKVFDKNIPSFERISELKKSIYIQSKKEYFSTEYAKEHNRKNPIEEIHENGNKIVRFTIMNEMETLYPILQGILLMLERREYTELQDLLEAQIYSILSWHDDKEYQKFKADQDKYKKETNNE